MPSLLVLLLLYVFLALADPTVIGHENVPPLDQITLQRIYTGKTVELNGARIMPVNLPPDNELRSRFLRDYLQQDEDEYTGYWIVRRYVGKGAPPQELRSPAEVVQFIAKTAGAIGYVDDNELPPDAKILLRLVHSK